MSNDQPKSPYPGMIASSIAGLLILLMVYILSTGPAIWLVEQGYANEEPLRYVYSPIGQCMRICPPFERAMMWYISFFSKEF